MKYAWIRTVLIAVLACSSISGVAWAARARSGALLHEPGLTPARAARMDRATARKEAALGIRRSAFGMLSLNKYGLQTRPVTNYRQETTYWCGPASARQSLSFHRSYSGSGSGLPSQTTLANRIGTTSDGSSTSAIASALNTYDGVFGSVGYIASNISDTSSPYETFVNRIGTMLRSITVNPTTPIILAQTKYIPRYKGVASRHYMTVSGINDNVSPMQMRSVDPHYNSAYYGIRWENVGSTTTNGLCRACYEADLAGSNRAMAW
jgi:hypothetical protein